MTASPDHDSNMGAAGFLALGALVFAWVPAVPVAEISAGLLIVAVLLRSLIGIDKLSGLPLFMAASCAFALLAIQKQCSVTSIIETAQLVGILFVITAAFFACADTWSRRLASIALVGWVASMICALLQYASGSQPEAVAAAIGSRALFGTVAAATLPLVLLAADRFPDNRKVLAVIAMVVSGGIAITYLPALLLFATATIASALLLKGACRRAALAGAALVMILIFSGLTPRNNLLLLRQSCATADSEGNPRRWVLEMQAALRAIADSPLVGHGPGSYQHTVSSARYRADLPATAEKRVERDSQCGYLVIAVEYGSLASLFLLLGLIGIGFQAVRRGEGHATAVGISVLLLAAGEGMTNLLIRGTGVLFAAIVGAAIAATESDRRRSLMWQAGVITISALLGVVAFLLGEATPERTHVTTSQDLVVIEAEQTTLPAEVMELIQDDHASDNKAISIKDKTHAELIKAQPATYSFTIPKAGSYHLWVRARWRDGCGNSIAAALKDAPAVLIGNDSTYGIWHWVQGPQLQLAAGNQRLTLVAREPGAQVDQICLASDSGFLPQGIVTSQGISTREGANFFSGARPWTQALPKRDKRFMVGICGAHAVGPEAYLVELGIPYRFMLEKEEMCNPKQMAKYDVIWLGGPADRLHVPMWSALETYVREGGTALIEVIQTRGKPSEAQQKLISPFTLFGRSEVARGLTITPKGSPFFEGLSSRTAIKHQYSRYYTIEGLGNLSDKVEMHGEVRFRGRVLGPAVAIKKYGKGTLYMIPGSLGLLSLRDEKPFFPAGRKLILHAIGERYKPLYQNLKWSNQPYGALQFHDDFMRRAGEGQAWKRTQGKVSLTSDSRGPLPPFALKTWQNTIAITGNDNWRDYRLSAAVNPLENAAAGIWLTTSTGRRLCLVLDNQQKKLTLNASDGKSLDPLRSKDTHGAGWHRLSLFKQDGAWECWMDGALSFTVPAGDETSKGKLGILCPKGTSYIDDVGVCSTSALIPGTDTTPGEEGSPRAKEPYTHGLEPRSIYSPHWLLRPREDMANTIQLGLPTYAPSYLVIEGALRGTIPPSPTGAIVSLPKDYELKSHIEVLCPLWRDYTFGAQTTDWYSTGDSWSKRERWACDRMWTFFGTDSQNTSILWHRQSLIPPYAVRLQVAPAMNRAFSRLERGADLNLVIGGNGKEIGDSITIRTSREQSGGCSIWHGEKLLARNEKVGLPLGQWSLHHRWFSMAAIVEKQRITFLFEDNETLTVDLSAPVPTGQVGFWTRRNAVRIARATISRSHK